MNPLRRRGPCPHHGAQGVHVGLRSFGLMPPTPHTGPAPWSKYGYGDAHIARLDNGWQLFVIKAEGQWRWNVNAPGGGGHLSGAEITERIRLKQAEQRDGTLQRGKTLRDAKKAAEAAARRCGVIT